MGVNRTSSQADIVAQYLDNVGYDHTNSVSSCKAFIEACRALLIIHPQNWSDEGAQIAFNPQLWHEEQQHAQQWLAANSTTSGQGSVKHLAFGSSFQ